MDLTERYEQLRALNTDEVGGKPPVVFKKKFRWTWQATFPGGEIDPRFVKLTMPTSVVNEQLWWRPSPDGGGFICTRYFGINPDKSQEWYPAKLFDVLADFFQFGSELFSDPESKLEHIKDRLGTGELTLWDGCGQKIETWKLTDVWPHSINFGELCYSTSDEIDIEVTWGYKEAEYVSTQKQ